MSKMQAFQAFVVSQEDGQDVFNIFPLIHEISARENINLDDMKNSFDNFELWCEHKNLPQVDSEGKSRRNSHIWCAQYQHEIRDKMWFCPEYCSFLSFFTEHYTCIFDDVDTIYLDYLLEQAQKEDMKQYGKLDYRTQAVNILMKHLENEFLFTNE
jgi:hypothetical protein